jgi:hypothetical protein
MDLKSTEYGGVDWICLAHMYSSLVGFRDHCYGATGCIREWEFEQLGCYKLSKKNFCETCYVGRYVGSRSCLLPQRSAPRFVITTFCVFN